MPRTLLSSREDLNRFFSLANDVQSHWPLHVRQLSTARPMAKPLYWRVPARPHANAFPEADHRDVLAWGFTSLPAGLRKEAGMKLLIYSHFFVPSIGGVETIVLSLARGLAEVRAEQGRMEFDITLVTQTPAGGHDDTALPFRAVRGPRLRELLH